MNLTGYWLSLIKPSILPFRPATSVIIVSGFTFELKRFIASTVLLIGVQTKIMSALQANSMLVEPSLIIFSARA